jgi:hypothetical protein
VKANLVAVTRASVAAPRSSSPDTLLTALARRLSSPVCARSVAKLRPPLPERYPSLPEIHPSAPEIHTPGPALRIPSCVMAAPVDEIPRSLSTSPPPSP